MEGTNGGFRKVIDSSEKRVVQTNQFGGELLLCEGISWSLAPNISPVAPLE